MSDERAAQSNIPELDQFSDLPEDVAYNILSRLPLMDAVRSSILCSKWRHHWTKLESLIIDSNFFDEHLGYDDDVNKIMSASTYENIVGSILSSHNGPIRKFFLHIPDFEDALNPNAIDMWIRSLSQCGVQDLSLEYDTKMEDLHIPLSLFRCLELKHLALASIKLEHPLSFRELSCLVSLELHIAFESGDMLKHIVLNCPMLERFSLDYAEIDVENAPFILSAPNLKLLSVGYYDYFHIMLGDTPNVSTFSLHREGGIRSPDEGTNEYKDIVDFFSAVPKVEAIEMNGNFLLEWAEQEIPKSVSVILENHKSLSVADLNMNSQDQLGSLCLLIKSSPKLQTLDISMYVPFKDDRPHNTKDYLQSQLREAENLRSVKTVKLAQIMGHEPEIIFIEIILSRCPMLEELYLSSNHLIRSEVEYKMMTRIMKLRRASTQAEVIYSKLKSGE